MPQGKHLGRSIASALLTALQDGQEDFKWPH